MVNPPEITNDSGGILKCQFAFLVNPFYSSSDSQSVPPAHRRVIAVKAIPQEIKRPRIRLKDLPIVNLQAVYTSNDHPGTKTHSKEQ